MWTAIFEKEKGYGYAYVVRDERGVVEAVHTRFLYGVVSPSMAEAIGIRGRP